MWRPKACVLCNETTLFDCPRDVVSLETRGFVKSRSLSKRMASSFNVDQDQGYGSGSGGWGIQTIAENLYVPWSIAPLPNGEIMVTERNGRVALVSPRAGGAGGVGGAAALGGLVTPLVHLPDVYEWGEGGLLGLALHPNFTNDQGGYIYFYYTSASTRKNRVVRYPYYPLSHQFLLQHGQVIVDDIPAAQHHNGGRIKFGPDRYLYIGTGDAMQPLLAQDLTSLAGKILRVDEFGQAPPSNPFRLHDPVYSLGHRNVQGLAWTSDGDMWATEHGDIGHDELNRIVPGGNYGWPFVQGDDEPHQPRQQQQGGGLVAATTMPMMPLRPPILHSGSDTWAPSGLAYQRGSLWFGGLRGETLYQVPLSYGAGGTTTRPPIFYWLTQRFGRLRDVVATPDGSGLYVTTSNTDGRGMLRPFDDRILYVPIPPGPSTSHQRLQPHQQPQPPGL